MHGHKYFVTFSEEFSRFFSVWLINSKSDASPSVLIYVRYFEKQSGQVVKKINTDGGTEFCRALTSILNQGVYVSMTTAYSP